MELSEDYGKISNGLIRDFYEKRRKSQIDRGSDPAYLIDVDKEYEKKINELKENDAYLMHVIKFKIEYSTSNGYKCDNIEMYLDNYGRSIFTPKELDNTLNKKLSNKIINRIKSTLNYNEIVFAVKENQFEHVFSFYRSIVKSIIGNEEIKIVI
jgi:hypothetical protein